MLDLHHTEGKGQTHSHPKLSLGRWKARGQHNGCDALRIKINAEFFVAVLAQLQQEWYS